MPPSDGVVFSCNILGVRTNAPSERSADNRSACWGNSLVPVGPVRGPAAVFAHRRLLRKVRRRRWRPSSADMDWKAQGVLSGHHEQSQWVSEWKLLWAIYKHPRNAIDLLLLLYMMANWLLCLYTYLVSSFRVAAFGSTPLWAMQRQDDTSMTLPANWTRQAITFLFGVSIGQWLEWSLL